ncbi:MAG TPA: tannase/feruloyl esterase family alpha/beta hydrolase [Burkholderiales bacterium]|nr:tannase/feruloyl esterase family alpha/beta hydrolase [Burkholderiales bacterium]
MKRPLLGVASATLICMLLQPVSAPAAMSCAALATLQLPETTITAAHEVPAGSFTPPVGAPLPNLPEFCRVALTVAPAIRIEVWLPKSTWNERYQGVGGGGYAGSISYGALATALRAGYATASTDTGHVGGSGTFALNPDGTLNWGLIEDFARRSLHEMVLKAKSIINAHYGATPKYSYWTGCSTGGRQGLMAVQQFPEEYDGLVIAAPAIHWERFIAAEIWPQIVMHQEVGAPIAATKLNAVNAAAVAACDAADGVADGVINDPRKCDFDPAALICPGGDSATCLTPQEANAVRKIWDGPTGAKTGNRLWFGLEPGASFAGLAGTIAFPIASTHLAYWVNQDPAFDWRSVTEAGFEEQFRTSFRKFNEVIGTDEDNLQEFRKRGGKVLMWHGEADQLIFPRGTVNYYERVVTGSGGLKHVDDFMRLFLAPGVAHCAGGVGPNPVGTLEAVVDWVENGIAPERLMAARQLPGGGVRTRPLCAYPNTAMWTGVGSTDDAANFVCVDGDHDAADFRITGFGSN